MKKEYKYKIEDFYTKIHLIIVFMFISSSVGFFVFKPFGNEEKLVALLVCSSFRRVATSGIRNSSVATSSVSWNSVSRAQIRSDSGITPYSPQHCSAV